MAEPDARRGLSANSRRAQRLLYAGLAGGHAALLVCVAAFGLARGGGGALSAAIAGVVTIAFFTIGQAVQVVVADAPARRVLIASLASYVLRVTVLGLLLALALDNADRIAWLDPVSVAATTIAVVIGWLAVELWVYSRMRIPTYDE